MDSQTANDTIEAAIAEFEGAHNRGLRMWIRQTIANGGNVRLIAKRVALNASELAQLEAVAKAVEASKESTEIAMTGNDLIKSSAMSGEIATYRLQGIDGEYEMMETLENQADHVIDRRRDGEIRYEGDGRVWGYDRKWTVRILVVANAVEASR